METIDCIDLCARHREGLGTMGQTTPGRAGTASIAIGGRERDCLYAAPGESLAFEIAGDERHLSFAFGLAPDTWGRPEFVPTRFRVLVDGVERFGAVVDPNDASDQRWHEGGVALAPTAGARTLRLEAAPSRAGECAWGVWGSPGLLRPAAMPAAGEVRLVDGALLAHRRSRETRRLLSSPLRKLNLGAGGFPLEGWLNVDGGDGRHYDAPQDERIVRLDVFDALAALPDGSMDYVHSEQFFEHFTRQEGLAMARECRRVLAAAGVLRIQVPDLESVVKLYRNELPFADWDTVQVPHRMRHIGGTRDPYGRLEAGEAYTRAIMINNGFHMDGHRFLYDFETLAQTLRLAGFGRVVRASFGESVHEALRGIDRHDGGATGASWVPRVALVVEASR